MNIFAAFPFFEFERPRSNRTRIGRIFSEVAAPVNVSRQDRSTDRVKTANQRCEWLFKSKLHSEIIDLSNLCALEHRLRARMNVDQELAECKHDIVRSKRLAIMPFDITAQLKAVLAAIRGNRPRLCQHGLRSEVEVIGQQTLKNFGAWKQRRRLKKKPRHYSGWFWPKYRLQNTTPDRGLGVDY